MAKKKFLLPESITPSAWALLKARDDIEAVPFSNAIQPPEFHVLLKNTHGVALGGTPMTAAAVEAAPELQVVARIGVGYDSVDIPALNRRRIPLMTTGIANSVSVAEHAVYFMLSLSRKAAAMDAIVREGRWTARYDAPPADLYGKAVLIVGFGRIGTRTAARCLAMEMTVLVYDPYVSPERIKAAGCQPVADLESAIPLADYITIHCPKSPETVGLFDAARLGLMKRSAFIVNTARGGIIDERALHAALAEGSIAGAALDVFEREPAAAGHPLFGLHNLIVSPHVAGVTREALERMSISTVNNMLGVIDGRIERENVVNKEVLD
jgi:D-3-phosphoglycerate dehydrogenase